MQLIAPKYKITPNQIKSHEDEKASQNEGKSYQDLVDCTKV